MILAIHEYYPLHSLTMADLDQLALGRRDEPFTEGASRRTAQELVAEGILKRESRGVYWVNKRRLAQAVQKIL